MISFPTIDRSTPFLLLFILLLATLPSWSQPAGAPSARSLGREGLRFRENRGQIVDAGGALRPDILFMGEGRGANVFFRKEGISYVFVTIEGDAAEYMRRQESHEEGRNENEKEIDDRAAASSPSPIMRYYRMDMELLGANPAPTVDAEAEGGDLANYYLAHCPNGVTGVRSWRRLIYRDIYPGIDMVINAGDAGMKCDFVVRPGGDPARIRMRYTGGAAAIAPDGSMRVANPMGAMAVDAPFSYQESAGERVAVPSRYLSDDGVIGFAVGAYDRTRTLVIDPEQRWGTYFGGEGVEDMVGGNPVAVDPSGGMLICGTTASTTAQQFPLRVGPWQSELAGGYDTFVAMLSSVGGLTWSTYWGGSRDDMAHGVAADREGNIFVVGHTLGGIPNNLPVSHPSQSEFGGGARDGIVAKFSSLRGTMTWGTFLGGDLWDDIYGCAVDTNGNLCVALTTGSHLAATLGGPKPSAAGSNDVNFDLLLLKLDTDQSLLWSRFHGGARMEYAMGVACDRRGNIAVSGATSSLDFPTINAAQAIYGGGSADAFAAEFSGAGAPLWSTYYGGTGVENYAFSSTASIPGGPAYAGVATDRDGNVFITGLATNGFPVRGEVFQRAFGGGNTDGFCVKLDPNGVAQWATYVGGNKNDLGASIATTGRGDVLIAGMTASTDLPIPLPPSHEKAFQSSFNGGSWDAFVVRLDGHGGEMWGSYFGGGGDDRGMAIAFDPHGAFLLAGTTMSEGLNFPLLDPYQSENSGSTDLFVSLFCDSEPPVIEASGPLTFTAGDSVTLSVIPGYEKVEWYANGPGSGFPIATGRSVVINASGEWYVKVTSRSGCETISEPISTVRLDSNPSAVPKENLEDLIEWLSLRRDK